MVLQCGGETNVALSLAEAQRGSLQGEQSEAGPQGAHRGNGVRDLKTTQSSRSIFQRCFSLALRSQNQLLEPGRKTASPSKRDGPFVFLLAGL